MYQFMDNGLGLDGKKNTLPFTSQLNCMNGKYMLIIHYKSTFLDAWRIPSIQLLLKPVPDTRSHLSLLLESLTLSYNHLAFKSCHPTTYQVTQLLLQRESLFICGCQLLLEGQHLLLPALQFSDQVCDLRRMWPPWDHGKGEAETTMGWIWMTNLQNND